MSTFYIRTLLADDADALLRFEQRNRAWFERHVVPRGDSFYSADGVRDHIRQFLDAHREGTLHPCLIVDDGGVVLGRANLKDIDRKAGIAEVGYRIAECEVGRGIAGEAVRHLMHLAQTHWQLDHLVAYVRGNNHASARVLQKSGFSRSEEVTKDHGSGIVTATYTIAICPASNELTAHAARAQC